MTYPIPKPREKSRWLNLSQGSLPLALARYLPHKRLKVVLTQDAEQALRLQTAWRFFRPHDTAVFLPDWETLPYERFSPHQDLVGKLTIKRLISIGMEINGDFLDHTGPMNG